MAQKKASTKASKTTVVSGKSTAEVLYTCYFGEEFHEAGIVFGNPTRSLKQFPGAPTGTEEEVKSWLEKTHGPISPNDVASMMLLVFEHGDAEAWNLANGKCVVIAKVGEFSSEEKKLKATSKPKKATRKVRNGSKAGRTTRCSSVRDQKKSIIRPKISQRGSNVPEGNDKGHGLSEKEDDHGNENFDIMKKAKSFFADDNIEDEKKESSLKALHQGEPRPAVNTETNKKAVLTIGKQKYTIELEKVEGGWSLNTINPSPTGNIIIPGTIDGKEIVQLGNSLCRYAEGLISIEIPDTVTEIKGQLFYGAFSGCAKLEKVKLSTNLKILGSGTFGDCTSLRDIELPNSIMTLGSYVFADSSLKTIKMPEGLAKVNASLFENCSDLERVEFQEGLVDVCQDVFKNCGALKEVVFPSTFDPDSLWSNMFCNCPNLQRVIFKASKPEGVDEAEFITDNFDECPKVKVFFAEQGHSSNSGRQTKASMKTNKTTAARKGKRTIGKTKETPPINNAVKLAAKKVKAKHLGSASKSGKKSSQTTGKPKKATQTKNKVAKTGRTRAKSSAKSPSLRSAIDFFS